ncbi:MAG: hypothetical protein ACRBBP_00530 [Bdellovibrionales bacterium]
MIKFVMMFLMMGAVSFAKVSTKKLGDFPQLCHSANRKVKNYPQYCECVKTNLRWLVDDADWEKTKDVYTGKISQEDMSSDETGLTEIDMMLVNVETACEKNRKYIAPKAKKIMSKKKN